MEMENKRTIDDFVKAVNANEDVRNALNKFVKETLPNGEQETDKYFQTLDEFANFLPNKIKEFFAKEENRSKIGEGWKNFEIDEKDVEKLYAINLDPKTKTEIINKFNMYKSDDKKRLSTQEDAKTAFYTFKKILGKNIVSVSDFYNFVNNNIAGEMLSSEDLYDILDCVESKEDEDKFSSWKFWILCYRFKEQPSKKFIDFMVNNTDFNKLSGAYLNSVILVLMEKHSAYKDNKTKENMFTALKDILTGQSHYEAFSQALLDAENIKEKINLDKIVKKTTDEDILGFVRDLVSNGINIKVNKQGGKKQFEIEKNAYEHYSEMCSLHLYHKSRS